MRLRFLYDSAKRYEKCNLETHLENIVYHYFRQLWLVSRVKLMEINSNLFSRQVCFAVSFQHFANHSLIEATEGIYPTADGWVPPAWPGNEEISRSEFFVWKIQSVAFSGTTNNGIPYPYYSHTTPIRIPKALNIWEWYGNSIGSLP